MEIVTVYDLASFADELVANAKTYVEEYREGLNQIIMKPLGKIRPRVPPRKSGEMHKSIWA